MKAEAPKPNFFIVGGPKCGTTAVYTYLASHPEIFMSPIKEPQLFASDILGDQRRIRTISEYLACFAAAGDQRRIVEASTAYLGSKVAASEIRAFSPDARIVVMLRNPVDVIYAQHSQRVFSNMEHIVEFEAALESQEPRIWRSGPFKNQEIVRLSYRELSRFAQQLRMYFDIFGREYVAVILYDDFKNNPRAIYEDLLRFLGVAWSETDFRTVNANRRARSVSLQEFVRYPPNRLQRAARMVLPRALRSAL